MQDTTSRATSAWHAVCWSRASARMEAGVAANFAAATNVRYVERLGGGIGSGSRTSALDCGG